MALPGDLCRWADPNDPNKTTDIVLFDSQQYIHNHIIKKLSKMNQTIINYLIILNIFVSLIYIIFELKMVKKIPHITLILIIIVSFITYNIYISSHFNIRIDLLITIPLTVLAIGICLKSLIKKNNQKP